MEHSPVAGPAVDEMSYTAASAELDGIVQFFEQREVDVDQLVARLTRATAIVEELDRRLRRTRVQVEQLVPKLAAVLDEPAGGSDPAQAGDEASEAPIGSAGTRRDPAPAAASPGRRSGGGPKEAGETPELFS